VSPFAVALLVAWLGFALKDSVDQALAREELHLTSVSEMQGLLSTLRKADVTKEDASAAALTLAAFGHYAIPSLMITLAEADDVRAPAAEEGLEAIGASEPEAVCKRLQTQIAERSGRHHYMTHIAALRLLGNIPCPAALPAVTAYRAEVDQLTTPASVDELRTQLSQTASLLQKTP
jgi:hypothetical protein